MSPLRELYGAQIQPSVRESPRLAIVLPAYNEQESVGEAIRQIHDALVEYKSLRIFVVNDGSHDETSKRAAAAGATVIDHRTNEGLGVAIATGVDAALRSGAEIIVTMDSDGQFKGYDVPDLIELLVNGRADITVGSRYLREDFIPIGTSWAKLTASRFMSYVVSQIVWGKRLTDVTCGFRAYTRDAAIRLSFLSRFTYTVESIIDAYYKGLRLVEVPVRVRTRREHGKSKMTANFPLYAVGILFILMRRMRDIRPLLFFTLYAFGSVIASFLALATFAHFWPNPASRALVTGIAGVMTMLFFILLAIALLADQLLTTTRFVHAVVHMQRAERYRVAHEEELEREQESGAVFDPRRYDRGPRDVDNSQRNGAADS